MSVESAPSNARGTFGRFGFVFAAVGSAIGLGNVWKFPYITWANKGGSFVLVYLVAVALIGAPIMLAEIIVGRRTQQSPYGALAELGRKTLGGKAWAAVGALGIFTGFVLLSYYSVIAGWTIYYIGRCFTWSVRGFDLTGPQLADTFSAFLGNGPLQVLFHFLFMALTVGVVALGVNAGIERVTQLLMPILGAILLLMVINSFWSPGFGDALHFLFHVGPLSPDAALEAVGHAFFTLSLGMGAMITYGSYMSRSNSIPRAGIYICVLDTLVALMACVVMFSIIFSVPEIERADTFRRSATILFTTLPRMFYSLPFGRLLSPLFYLLVAFAALTSTISLLEVVVSYFVDVQKWARRKASLVVGLAIFLFGIPAALSLGASSGLSSWAPFGDLSGGVLDTFDYTVSNWLLPVGGLLMALFVGWFLKPSESRSELETGHGRFSSFFPWQWALRLIAPAAILLILYAVIHGRSFA